MSTSSVSVASNFQTHLPVDAARRRIGKNVEQVPQPMLISAYNRGMGGVDLFDKLLGSYRPIIRGKKWWWPFFTNVVNISVVAAWRLFGWIHDKPGNKVSHLEFRRSIVLCLLRMTGDNVQRRSGSIADLPIMVRTDGEAHFNESTTQGRCKVCSTNTRNKCGKCNVRLHFADGKECFNIYHAK
jgi:hypothetical protein